MLGSIEYGKTFTFFTLWLASECRRTEQNAAVITMTKANAQNQAATNQYYKSY